MPVYHLNCGTLRPIWPRLEAIVYCLLVPTDDGLLLVDTGFGLQDYADPSTTMRCFLRLMGSPRDERETAVRQVEALGYAPDDVRDIVLTHLHLDHAGGLRDFPHATVHVHRKEVEAAMAPRGPLAWGYQRRQWSHGPRWALYDEPDGEWFGFPRICVREGLHPEVYLIPLHGHTRGHCGVAVRTEGGWLFHCGDAASPFQRAADPHRLSSDHQRLDVLHGGVTRWLIGPHVPQIRQLVQEHGDQVEVISGHDVHRYRAHASDARVVMDPAVLGP